MKTKTYKRVINVYGENYAQVHTVASRLSAITTIPILSHVHEKDVPFCILESTTKQFFSCGGCYNKCVDTNDMIDDNYIISIWDDAIRLFFPKDFDHET